MKIFNWVHQRFHHSVLKDEIAGNVKTTELTTNETDKQALLKQVSHTVVDHVLDNGWSDGILTIGTLGFYYPKPFNERKEYLILQSEEEDVESTEEQEHEEEEEEEEEEDYSIDDTGRDDDSEIVEHEEQNPLMFATFGHNVEDFESNHDHGNVVRPKGIITIDGSVRLTPFLGSSELSDELDKEEGEQLKKKGERITLADLFLADAPIEGKHGLKKVPNSAEKPAFRAKNGLSFAKKFIPRVKEDSRPIQTLQRLMKKMLKRKIHPHEFDVKMHKLDGQKTGKVGPVTNGKHIGASESLTLLPTQDATQFEI